MALYATLPLLAFAAERPNFAGYYEPATPSSGRIFKLSLTQDGSRVHAVFCASDAGDPDSQPTGEGDGRVNSDGVLEFKFKDSHENKGTATLVHEKDHYRFEMRVTKIADAAPLHFYGVLTMKRVGDPVATHKKSAGAM